MGAVRLRTEGFLGTGDDEFEWAMRMTFFTALRATRAAVVAMVTDLWLGEHGVAETVAEAAGVDADAARERVIAGIGEFATGRFTTPEKVATLVAMLATERTANVTGADDVIDGGLIKTT